MRERCVSSYFISQFPCFVTHPISDDLLTRHIGVGHEPGDALMLNMFSFSLLFPCNLLITVI